MIKSLAKKYKHHLRYLQIITLLLLIAVLYHFLPLNAKMKTFYIPSSKSSDILSTLQTHGYRITALDKLILFFAKTPQKGWYSVPEKFHGRFSFFTHLHRMKTDALMHITIYAGETKQEILHRLANDMKLDKKKLLKHYNKLARFKEGDILAQRYKLARKADEKATIHYLFHISSKKMQPYEDKNISIGHKPRDIKELLTIASIIQKESNSISEMPLISAVIHNRLNKNMHLQMDATLNYGPYAHTKVTKSRIKNDTSRYNTYKYKGIPPHPLSTVTLDALDATIHPAQKPYLFFMLTPTGAHTFSETYKEHLEKIAIFRKYQAKRKSSKNNENNESNDLNLSNVKHF